MSAAHDLPPRAIARMERWARWLREQNKAAFEPGSVSCSLLGALLGESVEAAGRFGAKAFSSKKPYAALIHGTGHPRPESQDDDDAEWEVQGVIDAMPARMREMKRVLYIEFLRSGTQDTKARQHHMEILTYKSHLRNGLWWVETHLSSRYS